MWNDRGVSNKKSTFPGSKSLKQIVFTVILYGKAFFFSLICPLGFYSEWGLMFSQHSSQKTRMERNRQVGNNCMGKNHDCPKD